MKRIVIIALALSFFVVFSSCSKESEEPGTSPPVSMVTPTPSETELPLYTKPADDGTINIFTVDLPFRHMFNEDCDAWEEYMLERYDAKFNLEFITYNYPYDIRGVKILEADAGIETEELKYLDDCNGFVVLNDIYALSRLHAAGLIQPVNEYISEIPAYTGLPDEILGGYTDRDGNIWALPMDDSIILPRRIYNKEWVEAYGKGAPSTLDEFIDFARYVAFEDPDGNGVDDTYIAAFNPSDILRSFGDVFAYFDCGVGYYPFGYDTESGKIVSACETEAFLNAMSAINIMVREGLILMDYQWSNTLDEPDSLDYRLASVMGVSYYPEYFEGYVIGDYWPSSDGEANVPAWVEHQGALAVLKDTEDVAEKFNAIYEIAASGMGGYMDLLAGMEGTNYEIKEDYVTLQMQTEEGSDIPTVGLNMRIALGSEGGLPIVYNGYQQNMLMYESGRVVSDEIRTKNLELFDADMVYTVPFIHGSHRLWNVRIFTSNYFSGMIRSIIDSYNSVEIAIDAYNQTMLAFGIGDILDEINKSE